MSGSFDIFASASLKPQGKGWMILVLGRANAGKSTFIDACTNERFLELYKDDSVRSHCTKDSYTFHSTSEEVAKECYFREIPSFLDDPISCAELIYEFARYLMLSHNKNQVAGIIYVLHHDEEVQPSLPEHLKFTGAWVGNQCSKSTAPVWYRHSGDAGSDSVPLLWKKHMGPRAQDPRDCKKGEERLVAQSVIISEDHILRLQKELMVDKMLLKDTTVGRLYSNQVKTWIQEKERLKSELSRLSSQRSNLKRDIAVLEKHKKTWEDMRFPYDARGHRLV